MGLYFELINSKRLSRMLSAENGMHEIQPMWPPVIKNLAPWAISPAIGWVVGQSKACHAEFYSVDMSRTTHDGILLLILSLLHITPRLIHVARSPTRKSSSSTDLPFLVDYAISSLWK
jgi:hypothetical protein